MTLTAWLPLATVVVAIVGALVAVLKFPTERASAVVQQQSTVLADMRSLNADLAVTAERVRSERDRLAQQLLEQVQECNRRVRGLEGQIEESALHIRGLETEIGLLREGIARGRPRRAGDPQLSRREDQS